MNEDDPVRGWEADTSDADLHSVWQLILILTAAAAIALVPTQFDLKYGYTYSLALFVLPLARLGWWFFQRKDLKTQRKAWLISTAIILPLWCLLDILAARSFFVFPNDDAHINLLVIGYKPPWDWAATIPVEEFLFYGTGVLIILLTYIWASEAWMTRYTHSDDFRRRNVTRLYHPFWGALGVGAAIFGAALLWKYFGPHGSREGFPAYLLFLMTTAVVPIALFARIVGPFVNWRAFSFTLVSMLFVCLLWEGTLGLPYGYWNYQPEAMLGIFIEAWGGLPIEEPLLWVACSWLNVISYEMIRLLLATGRPITDIFRHEQAEEAA